MLPLESFPPDDKPDSFTAESEDFFLKETASQLSWAIYQPFSVSISTHQCVIEFPVSGPVIADPIPLRNPTKPVLSQHDLTRISTTLSDLSTLSQRRGTWLLEVIAADTAFAPIATAVPPPSSQKNWYNSSRTHQNSIFKFECVIRIKNAWLVESDR